MKSREEAARLAEFLMYSTIMNRKFEKGDHLNFGLQELRELLDFIYEYEPTSDGEMIKDRGIDYD